MNKAEIYKSVAAAIGTDPVALKNLITFESGENPQIKNPNPRASARGLIQFTDATARQLGYNDSLDLVTKNPDFESQMNGPVKAYFTRLWPLKRLTDPVAKEQALYMTVFYPKYRYVNIDTVFPPRVLQDNKPIRTPRDYINFVRRRARLPALAAGGGLVLALALLGIYFFFIKRRA